MSKNFEFKAQLANFGEIINEITSDNPSVRLFYIKENDDYIGYVTFKNSTTISDLQKYSSEITWTIVTNTLINCLEEILNQFVEDNKKLENS